MYASYFGCREQPFRITPDPHFFYANGGNEEAFANLLYGIRERKGFIVLTGEVGAGKTTLLRRLMDELDGSAHFVFFYNTKLTFEEMLDFICQDFGLSVAPAASRLQKIQALNDFLLAQLAAGGSGVLLIDEAQNLSDEVLENLRLLSNLETAQEKLLQIILVGQPELDRKLRQPHLRQLQQRVVIWCKLDLLSDHEVGPYIKYRLQTAGCKRRDVFSPEAIQRIAFYAKGAPRLINVICDNALLIAYGASQARVSVEIIEEVARDLGLRETRRTLKWAPPTRFQPQPATPIVQQTAAPAKTSAREAPQLFSPRPVIRESIPAAIFPGSQKNVGAVRGAAPTTLPGGNASTTASPETTNGRRAWRSVLTASFVIFLVAVLGFLQLRSSSLWPTIVAVLTHFRSPSPDTRFVPQEPVPSISTTSPSAIVEQDRPSEPRTDPPLEERLEPPQTRISPIAIQSAPFRAQRMSEPSKQEVTK